MKIILTILFGIGIIVCAVWGISKIPATVYLTNDQVIYETKKCENAGLRTNTLYNGFNYKIRMIECIPLSH